MKQTANMLKADMINFTLFLMFSLVLSGFNEISAEDADGKPLSPVEALEKMTVPNGFHVSLFTGEPDVVQPISFCFDDRGRLWVIECYSYPDWTEEKKDRVLIFEDSNGDGKFDKRKVFWDQGVNLSGIEYGFGGIWLCSVPNFIFLPDADGDDVPDGPPEVILDGWDLEARHNVFNGLTWGPDGWLYGLNGILSKSKVGKPGSPDEERTGIDCGVWRYHPVKDRFEAFAHGTTNPWGLDFDEFGQMFITNCVIKHLWHVVPGAHFRRMFGEDLNSDTFQLLESIADHFHWGGGNWTASRVGIQKHDSAGGGHAHVGAMIYQGDNWPEQFRNRVFTCNVHGHRVNQDLLEFHGSSYVARHGKDFLFANDDWFRGLELKYGPDGGVYVTDWNDTGECHDYLSTHRGTGRIYKVTYGEIKNSPFNLKEYSDSELLKLQNHRNEWYVSRSRRLLQERASQGQLNEYVHTDLWNLFKQSKDVKRQLRYLWVLHSIGKISGKDYFNLFQHESSHIRGWAIRFCTEDKTVSDHLLKEMARLAKEDPASSVRLALASALQSLPVDQRWEIASELVLHEKDQNDHYLPLMNWYGIEELVASHPERGLQLLQISRIPILQKLIVRKLSKNRLIYQFLAETNNEKMKLQILRGLQEAFFGQKSVNIPVSKETVFENLKNNSNPEIQLLTRLLSLQFGVKSAPLELRNLLADRDQSIEYREKSLVALVQFHDPKLVPLLCELLDEKELVGSALNGMASYDDSKIPEAILKRYSMFLPGQQKKAIGTLCSRTGYALVLLDSIEKKKIPTADLSAYSVRQLLALKHSGIRKKIESVWGVSRKSSSQKIEQMNHLKKLLTADVLTNGDQLKGNELFKKICASCHRLHGEGGKIGPDLTGSQRKNLEYVVQNLVDPNALVGKDYQMTVIQTSAGRTLSGIVISENEKTLTIQTPTDQVILPVNDIEERKKQSISMMPEGMLDKLKEEEIINLVAYLQGDYQIVLPE
jgi:putative membrane-bound dehydrogenase-like protein